jgi:hypothetical protein
MLKLVESRVVTGSAVQERLRELDLDEAVLLRAVAEGDSADATCTENDPVTLGGSLRWGRAVRSLREDLRPRGWTKCDADNLPTIVHPKQRLAIAVARGNESTGDMSAEPSTKYSRGPACQTRVDRNAQMALFEAKASPKPAPRRVIPREGMPTYFLLVHPSNGRVEFELVLPSACDENGRFSSFVERIILTPYTRDPQPFGKKEVEEPLRVDVPVTRR